MVPSINHIMPLMPDLTADDIASPIDVPKFENLSLILPQILLKKSTIGANTFFTALKALPQMFLKNSATGLNIPLMSPHRLENQFFNRVPQDSYLLGFRPVCKSLGKSSTNVLRESYDILAIALEM